MGWLGLVSEYVHWSLWDLISKALCGWSTCGLMVLESLGHEWQFSPLL